MDISLQSIDVNLWGLICVKDGESIKKLKASKPHLVLAIRNGSVLEFKGKVINTIVAAILTIESSIPEAKALRSMLQGKESEIPSFSTFSTNNNIATSSLTIVNVLQ